MRRFLLALLFLPCLLAVAPARADAPLGPIERPLWLRYSQISPDGTQIVFAFEGNLFVVPTAGGTARLLVGNGHHSFRPVWSPDGRRVAYASDVFGNFDVFVVSADGGPSRRLTTHSADELPLGFTPDGHEVLFSATRMDSRRNALFPGRGMGELYKVPIEPGRRPVQVLTTPVSAARYDATGRRLLYEDLKGYENAWRKHHVSPVAHDIWLLDAASGRHTRLTDFGGEDRDPVWSPDGASFYFLSERSGSFNVWRQPAAPGAAPVQLTRFTTNPVRFLSVAANGVVSFGYDGELYTLAPDAGVPVRVPVRIGADLRVDPVENRKLPKGATEVALSPDGQEVAFVLRGHVFVASTEFGDTRRITDGAAQARSVSFSPDGRRLVFASEEGSSWGLYEARVADARRDSPFFFGAAQVRIRTVLKNAHENFQPRYSPDGRELAFLEDRVTLKVLDLSTGAARVVLPGSYNYSYSDGDQWFDWSPDGRHLLATFVDRNRWSSEVGLVDAAGLEPLQNLTQSGYEDSHPVWTRGGQQMMWFSDRMGLHGTGGSSQQDLFAMFFTREAFDRFNLDKTEFALLKRQEDEESKARDELRTAASPKAADRRSGAQKEADKKDKRVASAREKAGLPDGPIELAPRVAIERDNLEERTARLTPNSAMLRAAAMTPDGETLFFVTQTATSVELWIDRIRGKELRKVTDLPAPKPTFSETPPAVDVVLDAKGESGVLLVDGGLQKFKVPREGLEVKVEPLAFSAELRADHGQERAQMFEHVWRQTKEKLYVADMNGVDWNAYRAVYEKFLPYVVDNRDFAELLSEMLGELNVSHTGSGYRPPPEGADATAALGVFFDEAYAGDGLKVAEVIDGGPLASARSRVREGMVVESIDGTPILAGREVDSLLDQRAGKRLELGLLDPKTGLRFVEVVKPITLDAQDELLYKRWVRTEREAVDRLSGGRLGYVHVRAMDDDSYRDVYAEVLGRQSGKAALIVDTRFNGGGNLHDELATLLSGRRYLEFVPRGESLGWEPSGKWTKPSLVLISESNYSDAHLFPWTYRHFGLGKLVGMPVAGTGTAVWWELLQDETLYFGIPQVGFRDQRGDFMEQALIEPDVQVRNDADQLAAGRDQQLEAAVRLLLEATK